MERIGGNITMERFYSPLPDLPFVHHKYEVLEQKVVVSVLLKLHSVHLSQSSCFVSDASVWRNFSTEFPVKDERPRTAPPLILNTKEDTVSQEES